MPELSQAEVWSSSPSQLSAATLGGSASPKPCFTAWERTASIKQIAQYCMRFASALVGFSPALLWAAISDLLLPSMFHLLHVSPWARLNRVGGAVFGIYVLFFILLHPFHHSLLPFIQDNLLVFESSVWVVYQTELNEFISLIFSVVCWVYVCLSNVN